MARHRILHKQGKRGSNILPLRLCVSALITDPELKPLFQLDLVTLRDDKTLRREYIHQSHVDREDSTENMAQP